MSKVKIKLNSSGVKEMLKSPQMQKICHEHAKKIASRCGGGYTADIYVGRTRANAMVWPDTPEAKRDNIENNTILKALK